MRPLGSVAVLALVCVVLGTSAFAQYPYRPVIDSIEPLSAPPEGGTIVTIRGKNLMSVSGFARTLKPDCTPCPPRPPIVSFGDKPAEVISYEYDKLVVKAPPSAGGLYDVQVDNGYFSATPTTLSRVFQYGEIHYPPSFDRVLVPVVADRIPGAFGSIWSTELVGRNDNDFDVVVKQFDAATSGAWSGGARNSTFRPQLVTSAGAAFLYIEHVYSGFPVTLNLRVRDLSRQADSWGTEIPVVRAEQAFVNRPMDLLNVPFEPESRITLRIYDLDGPTGGTVPVSVRDNESNVVLGSAAVAMPPGDYLTHPIVPGYAQIDVGSLIANASAVDRVRIRVGDAALQKRLWAMISVTDLETQQVTLITPQK